MPAEASDIASEDAVARAAAEGDEPAGPPAGGEPAGRAAEGLTASGEPAAAEEPASDEPAEPPAGGESMGLGVGILEISRMEKALSRTPRIKERAFSEAERRWCDSRPNPAVHYALTFAAKEAVAKALGPGCAGMRLRDVEVDRSKRGRPRAMLTGVPAAEAARQGVREVFLSLSYTHSTAVASAAAVRDEDVPEQHEKPSAAELIASRFKDVRVLLDGMDEILPGATATGGSPTDETAEEDDRENDAI